MIIELRKTNGCDELSHIYGKMFNVLQDVMHNEEKLKELSPLDYSALGMYIGKFVEQEINSSVVQIMRDFCGIEMPEFYCRRDPSVYEDAIVNVERRKYNLNEQKDYGDIYSLKTIPAGDAFYILQQLKREDEDAFFRKKYSWLYDKAFIEAWRKLFRFRNEVAHIGVLIDKNTLKGAFTFFETFLGYMPKMLEAKKALAPENYIESISKTEKIKNEVIYWTSTENRDKPYAPYKVAKRFCELLDWDINASDYYERMDEKNKILEKYNLDAKIFEGPDGKKGLRDCLGGTLVPAKYDGFFFLPKTLGCDVKNKSVIAIRNDKYVLTSIDGKGTELTKQEYDVIKLARNDHPYTAYIYKKNGAQSWGFMDKLGKEICDCIIDSYGLGLNSLVYESGKYQGYWQFGFNILPPIYDNIEAPEDLDEPLIFTLNGEPGYVHHDGSFLSLDELKRLEEEGEEIIWDFFCEQYNY